MCPLCVYVYLTRLRPRWLTLGFAPLVTSTRAQARKQVGSTQFINTRRLRVATQRDEELSQRINNLHVVRVRKVEVRNCVVVVLSFCSQLCASVFY